MRGGISIPHADLGDLDCTYLIQVDASVRRIRYSSIVATQDRIFQKHIRRYLDHFTWRDREGNLPFGIRFAGSRMVYLVDGHHRWWAGRLLGRQEMRLAVVDYDVTLEEAISVRELVAV